MNPDYIPLTTPGEDLREILNGQGITAYALAKAIGKASIQVTRIINGTQGITPDMSILIGEALGMSLGYWLRVQTDYDLRKARQRPHAPVERLVSAA